MRRHSMYIGCHGYDHVWMGHLPPQEQASELDRALGFLKNDIGCDLREWVMCYPYGDHSESLRELIGKRGCVLGLTTEVALATRDRDPLLYPRLDTNDLPKAHDAAPVQWTQAVAGA